MHKLLGRHEYVQGSGKDMFVDICSVCVKRRERVSKTDYAGLSALTSTSTTESGSTLTIDKMNEAIKSMWEYDET